MADFQSRFSHFQHLAIGLVAASVDALTDARQTIDKLGLQFSVAYGADCVHVASLTGAFYSQAKRYLHATGFIINPDGLVEEAVYSTGPIGRFTAHDVLALLEPKIKGK